MPDNRNEFQRRPQRMPERSGGRNIYEASPRKYQREGRSEYDEGYAPERSRAGRGRQSAFHPEDEYHPRREHHAAPGEYLADSSDDRYALPEENVTGREYGFEGDRNKSAGFDAFLADDDFSDLDSFDEIDEWVASHSQKSTDSRRRPYRAPGRASAGWSEENGFDGFEDDEDVQRARRRRTPPKAGEGWFEEDEMSSGRGMQGRPAAAPGMNSANRKKIIFGALCSGVAVVALVVAMIMIFGGSSKGKIPMDSVVDAITPEQADTLVAAFIDRTFDTAECTVSVDGKTQTMKLSDCEITYEGRHAGETGSQYVLATNDQTGELERTEYAFSGLLRYNKTALRSFLDSMLDETSQPAVDPYFEVDYENSVMTVYAGTDGWGVDPEDFLRQMTSALAASGGGNISVSCSSGTVRARQMSAADIYSQAASQPVDAFTTTDASGETVYHSEINGVEFSQKDLEKLLASGSGPWQLPVAVTYPQTTLKDIRKYTFPDVLATYYTYYSTGNAERSHNLSLAAEHINSLIMEPGDQFSFNERVGERTKANGFQKAGVYAGEGTAEDYGGGICQTSSTLYYTCILANLQIDERRNHLYTVGYMQTAQGRNTVFGNDATVNWGTTDFKFTNSKEYPIRIDIVAKDGILTCEIRGTADGYTADFAYETVETTPYKIKYLKDNGTDDQAGQTGYKVNVYRIVYKDGVEVDRYRESKNTYNPMNKVIYTDEIPAGFEYGVEYDLDYTPSPDSLTTAAPTETTTAAPETTTAAPTTTTAAPPPADPGGEPVG